MPTRLCALTVGAIYLFFGACGFIPALLFPPPDRVEYANMEMAGGMAFLFSWMPVNPLHNILYCAIGGAGILAAVAFFTARLYCQGVFALSVLLVFTGFAPLGISYLWGLLPLFGWNVMFNTVMALLLYYSYNATRSIFG